MPVLVNMRRLYLKHSLEDIDNILMVLNEI
jgi:hypothetical protein